MSFPLLSSLVLYSLLFNWLVCNVNTRIINLGKDTNEIKNLKGLSPEKKQELEHEFHQFLNLSESSYYKHDKVNNSALQFLLRIYRNQNHHNGNSGVSDRYIKIAEESDDIVTFSTKKDFEKIDDKLGRILHFDIAKLPSDKVLIAAELRIYWSFIFSELTKDEPFTITVYFVSSKNDEPMSLEYVDSLNITNQEGWISLNLISPLRQWIMDPKMKNNLYITIRLRGEIEHEFKMENLLSLEKYEDRQPFIISFFKNSNETETVSRRKRSHDIGTTEDFFEMQSDDTASSSNPVLCNLHKFYVSFRDIGLDNVIIAPKGYYAHYCFGKCAFPIASHLNPTNHAVVQSMINSATDGNIPEACCIPNKLSSITVIYYLDDNKTVLKKMSDMVVESCSCR